MSFNWPTTGFTGTEVEAFETAYKELATSIIEDYDNFKVNLEKLKIPYLDRYNMQLFLNQGLLYASFIIKQRAGNSGPGTNFNLSGSPFRPMIPPFPLIGMPDSSSADDQDEREEISDAMRKDMLSKLGCVFEDKAMKSCYKENLENDDTIGVGPEDVDPPYPTDDAWNDLIDFIQGKGEDIRCDGFLQKYKVLDDSVIATSQEGGTTSRAATLIAKVAERIAATAMTDRWSYWLNVQWRWLLIYLSGSKTTVDRQWFKNNIHYWADHWVAEDVVKYMKKGHGSITCIQGLGGESDCPAGYGLNNGDRVYLVNGEHFYGFQNTFGSFTVITDIDKDDPSFSKENIKQIRDDYDFKYGWDIARHLGTGNQTLPGEEFDDDMIQSGVFYRCHDMHCSQPRTNPDNTTRCDAAEVPGNGWFSPMFRYTIADDHGNGNKDPGEHIPGRAKPFPIKIIFNW